MAFMELGICPTQVICPLNHIKFGTMLFIRGDVVHSGGCPTSPSQSYDATLLYNCLHFYIPNVPEDIPPNGIFCHNVDGPLFSKDYHYE